MPIINHQDIYDDFKIDLAGHITKGNETNTVLTAHFRKLARHINRVHQDELEEAVKIGRAHV